MTDYDRIARVIHHLEAHQTEQPGLESLARNVGLSPFHFHRLFSSWAGITPKDFLQCLTLENVKERLRNGASVLDASLDAGLSGPGRLHDLCVSIEAASPGELKSGGTGWTISAGFAPSVFGTCLVAEGRRGICHLSFVEEGNERHAWSGLQADWPNAVLRRDDSASAMLANRIFARPVNARSRPALRAFVRGTPFQVRVWRALLQVAPGELTTYRRLAAAAGIPEAARAVGTAVGKNPLAYLIPCHRVIRETGVIGKYRWGTTRKRAMLARETA